MNEAATIFELKKSTVNSFTKRVFNNFWKKVSKNGNVQLHVPELGKCWDWIGPTNRSGYGIVGHPLHLAHRLSYLIHVSKIPENIHCLHKCDNPRCVNPEHLWLGTNADNVADKVKKGRAIGLAGDNNPMRKHPEKVVRGENHHWHTRPETRIIGTKHWNCKINDEISIKIRQSINAGNRIREIANTFCVSRYIVYEIKRGRAWKHTLKSSG